MPIVDLVDRDGYLIGRDTLGFETQQTMCDDYIMQIRDGEGVIHVIPVPSYNLPIDPQTVEIYDIGVVI